MKNDANINIWIRHKHIQNATLRLLSLLLFCNKSRKLPKQMFSSGMNASLSFWFGTFGPLIKCDIVVFCRTTTYVYDSIYIWIHIHVDILFALDFFFSSPTCLMSMVVSSSSFEFVLRTGTHNVITYCPPHLFSKFLQRFFLYFSACFRFLIFASKNNSKIFFFLFFFPYFLLFAFFVCSCWSFFFLLIRFILFVKQLLSLLYTCYVTIHIRVGIYSILYMHDVTVLSNDIPVTWTDSSGWWSRGRQRLLEIDGCRREELRIVSWYIQRLGCGCFWTCEKAF